MKEQHFVLNGIDTYSGNRLAFTECNISTQTTVDGLTECHIHYHATEHSIASHQGTHITVNEVLEWTHAHDFHWSCHIPHLPEAAGLTEC